ncbi:MAG: hypothetical protein EHM20_08025 [Alphaproteobacteria bacterium]|nr:MAG: hypothetical protein EHM20_08025 [Alphaproteobacteria bacterium]
MYSTLNQVKKYFESREHFTVVKNKTLFVKPPLGCEFRSDAINVYKAMLSDDWNIEKHIMEPNVLVITKKGKEGKLQQNNDSK